MSGALAQSARSRLRTRRLLWFAAIWAASVLVTLAVSGGLHWWFDRLLSGHLL